ncbi:hypothetical protein DFH06DRAFT_922199, partial [Mycena polygramma]
TIDLESACGFELNDSICAQMARAWPRVERLTLREYYSPLTHSVTLESLRSFAQHCPALITLQVTLDARVVPREEHTENISQMSLEYLHVGYSLIELSNPRPVGIFVGTIFPNLKCVTNADDDAYKYR